MPFPGVYIGMTDVMNTTMTLSDSSSGFSGIGDQYTFPVAVLLLSAVAVWLIYNAMKDSY
jgi:hypothetical protein